MRICARSWRCDVYMRITLLFECILFIMSLKRRSRKINCTMQGYWIARSCQCSKVLCPQWFWARCYAVKCSLIAVKGWLFFCCKLQSVMFTMATTQVGVVVPLSTQPGSLSQFSKLHWRKCWYYHTWQRWTEVQIWAKVRESDYSTSNLQKIQFCYSTTQNRGSVHRSKTLEQTCRVHGADQ